MEKNFRSYQVLGFQKLFKSVTPFLWVALVSLVPHVSSAQNILIYGPTFNAKSPEATVPGTTVTVWDAATWVSKTTADFAAFDAIVFAYGPAPCIGTLSPSIWSTAVSNISVWSPAVLGNVFIRGIPGWLGARQGNRRVDTLRGPLSIVNSQADGHAQHMG